MERLTKEDCKYENGFPSNILWSETVVVQMPENGQGVVLYTCSCRLYQTKCYLPLELNKKYLSDIYVLTNGDKTNE